MAIAHAAVGGVVVNIILPLASIIFVALRFHVRIKTRQPLLGDDWTILGALVRLSGLLFGRFYLTDGVGMLPCSSMYVNMGSCVRYQRYTLGPVDAGRVHHLPKGEYY